MSNIRVIFTIVVICCLSVVGSIIGMVVGAILVPLKFLDGRLNFDFDKSTSNIGDSSDTDQI